jgi:hypothetical protein
MTQQIENPPAEDQVDKSRRVLKEMNDKTDQVVDEQTGRVAPVTPGSILA